MTCGYHRWKRSGRNSLSHAGTVGDNLAARSVEVIGPLRGNEITSFK